MDGVTGQKAKSGSGQKRPADDDDDGHYLYLLLLDPSLITLLL